MPMSPYQVVEPRKSAQNLPEKPKTYKDSQLKYTQANGNQKSTQNMSQFGFENNKIDEEEEYQRGFLDGEEDNYQIKAKDGRPVSLHHINLSMKSGSHYESNNPETKVKFINKADQSAYQYSSLGRPHPSSSREVEQYRPESG